MSPRSVTTRLLEVPRASLVSSLTDAPRGRNRPDPHSRLALPRELSDDVPSFGRALRSEWLLDPEVTYLNHATVGATPRRVLERQRELTDEIERNPARFMLRELDDSTGANTTTTRLREAAAEVARFVGADADGLCFVDNITTGANAVLRSFPLAPGDEIAVTSLGYGGVTNAVRYAARLAGAEVPHDRAPLAGQRRLSGSSLRSPPGSGRRRGCSSSTTSPRTPPSSSPLPRSRPSPTLAASPSSQTERTCPGTSSLDIGSLGVDWYAANLHKWALAPRSSGFLWVAEEWRPTTRPVVISWGLDNGLIAEFDHPGTRDPTPFLTAPYALELLAELGGGDAERRLRAQPRAGELGGCLPRRSARHRVHDPTRDGQLDGHRRIAGAARHEPSLTPRRLRPRSSGPGSRHRCSRCRTVSRSVSARRSTASATTSCGSATRLLELDALVDRRELGRARAFGSPTPRTRRGRTTRRGSRRRACGSASR